jgi:hypothetical protein
MVEMELRTLTAFHRYPMTCQNLHSPPRICIGRASAAAQSLPSTPETPPAAPRLFLEEPKEMPLLVMELAVVLRHPMKSLSGEGALAPMFLGLGSVLSARNGPTGTNGSGSQLKLHRVRSSGAASDPPNRRTSRKINVEGACP